MGFQWLKLWIFMVFSISKRVCASIRTNSALIVKWLFQYPKYRSFKNITQNLHPLGLRAGTQTCLPSIFISRMILHLNCRFGENWGDLGYIWENKIFQWHFQIFTINRLSKSTYILWTALHSYHIKHNFLINTITYNISPILNSHNFRSN